MLTVRDVMTTQVEVARAHDTLVDVARKMKEADVGSLPICGEDGQLEGMITDRDIVVGCVAAGCDPYNILVEEYASLEPVTIGADDSLELTLKTMAEHGVRRLPVIDGRTLVGIVSQSDVARRVDAQSVGHLVEAIAKAPPN